LFVQGTHTSHHLSGLALARFVAAFFLGHTVNGFITIVRADQVPVVGNAFVLLAFFLTVFFFAIG
jgi:hypothetical protein